LELAKVSYELKIVDLRNNQHKTEEYLQKSPLGTVPMWEEDGVCMVESGSILRYLADKHKINIQGDSVYPEDEPSRHKVDVWLDLNGNTI